MKKILTGLFIFIGTAAVVFIFQQASLFQQPQKSALKIETQPQTTIFLENEHLGKSPFYSETLKPGNYILKLSTSDLEWIGRVKLNPSTVTVVKRELDQTLSSSSGEILTLEKGEGLMIISQPELANVEIDGQKQGPTPIVLKNLSEGIHKVILDKSGYQTKTIDIDIQKNYQLTLDVQLAKALAKEITVSTPSSSSSALTAQKKVKIKETGTGWLRIRSGAGTGFAEITKVNVGQILPLLEEKKDWWKISLEDGRQGWASSSFLEKINP